MPVVQRYGNFFPPYEELLSLDLKNRTALHAVTTTAANRIMPRTMGVPKNSNVEIPESPRITKSHRAS
jgi:hypothetical protein